MILMNFKSKKNLLLAVTLLMLGFLIFDGLYKTTDIFSISDGRRSIAQVLFSKEKLKGSSENKIEFLDLASLLEEYKETPEQKNRKNISSKTKDKFIISFVGDISPFDISYKDNLEIGHDLRSILKSSDILVGNLEGVITTSEESKCVNFIRNCFAFKGNSEFAEGLKNLGFNVLNMANNHTFDFGENGSLETMNSLRENNILFTGLPNEDIPVLEIYNTKVSFVGFSPNKNTNFLSKYNIRKTINQAKEISDIVVAIIHAGAEGVNAINIPFGDEVYLGENRGNTKALAREIIDSGADMVFGSGPHVLRGIEKYNEKVIAYSLGNFISHNNLSKKDLMSVSAILSIEINTSGDIKSLLLTPLIIDNLGMPRLDHNKEAINLVNRLSFEDFEPGQTIILDANGLNVFD